MSRPNSVILRCSPGAERNHEAGYLLIGVLVLAALMLIALAIAAPVVAADLQRDKESELYHRGLQYASAIRRYYRRFGAYPNSLDQLEKTNQIRFLRKRYKDPITGKAEWKLIRYGQARTTGTNLPGQPGQSGGSAGGNANGTSPGNDPFGNNGNTGGANGTGSGTSTGLGSTGTGLGSTGSGNGGSTPGGLSGTSPIGGSTTFGGGQIIGVSSTSPKQSIREFKKQTHYNQWEFVYDPSQDNRGGSGTGVSTPPGTPAGTNPGIQQTGPGITPPSANQTPPPTQ